ncbi:MAG: adenosylcobinamide-GDP ribazoletransferase [bacterium]
MAASKMNIVKNFLNAVSFLTIFNFNSINSNDKNKTFKSRADLSGDINICPNAEIGEGIGAKNFFKVKSSSLDEINKVDSIDSSLGNINNSLVKSIKFFPLAGLFIGLIIAFLYVIFNKITSPNIAPIISIIGLFIITGGLHFDGLSDTSDGLMAFLKTGDKNIFYKAMKDINTGLAGTISVIFYIIILYEIILDFNSFQSYQKIYGIYALITFPVIGRYIIVLMSYFTVTPENFKGIGSIFTEGTDMLTFVAASLITSIIVFLFFGFNGFFALLVSSFMILIICYFFMKKFGGINGDMLGFGVKISEIVFLISLLGFIKTGF